MSNDNNLTAVLRNPFDLSHKPLKVWHYAHNKRQDSMIKAVVIETYILSVHFKEVYVVETKPLLLSLCFFKHPSCNIYADNLTGFRIERKGKAGSDTNLNNSLAALNANFF